MRVVSFFAGCGGLDLGFEQAGFDVVWANEFEPHCRATYLRNHPHTEFVLGDICKIAPDTIPDCDGFIGGPPCQSWSVGGKMKGLDDERGQLFLKYIDLIKAKQPKFFVIENVKGMLDDKFKEVFEDFTYYPDTLGGYPCTRDTIPLVLGGALNNFFDNVEGIWEGVKESMDGVIDVIEGVFSGNWEQAWNGIKDIFGGIFDALFESAKIPLNGIIDFLNAIIDGANWCIEKLNQIPGVNLDTIGDIPFLAKGGTVYSGSAVVGDAGPEILTVAGGKATVTPLTATVDGRSLAQAIGSQAYRTNVQVSFTGSLSQLAAVLQPAIVAETERIGGSFTR